MFRCILEQGIFAPHSYRWLSSREALHNGNTPMQLKEIFFSPKNLKISVEKNGYFWSKN